MVLEGFILKMATLPLVWPAPIPCDTHHFALLFHWHHLGAARPDEWLVLGLRLGSITIMVGEWQFCLPLQYQHGTASPMQNVQNINLISTQFPDKKSWWKTVIDSLFPKKRWGKFSMTSLATNTWNRNKCIYIIIHGPPKPTCLEVFMVNHMVFRWPKPFIFLWFWGQKW